MYDSKIGMLKLLENYLFSKNRLGLWLLFFVLLGAYAFNIRLAVAMNEWNGRFFDALQQLDKETIYRELLYFTLLASGIILLLVTAGYLKKRLILAIRRDITFIFFERWLSPGSAHYLLRESGKEPDNPDQRITEDVSRLVSLSVGLIFSFVDSVLTIGSFSVILWKLSGSVTVFGIDIPGYMFWLCLAYTVLSTGITHLIGRKLKDLNVEAEHREADLRASLMEKRRHADAVAGARGEAVEREYLKERFTKLMNVIIAYLKKQRDLDYFTVGLGQVTHLAPIFFSLPSFFAGTIQMGGLMQIRGAFVDVARSLSWFIFAYDELAALAATFERLSRLEEGLQKSDVTRRENLQRIKKSEKGLSADLRISVPSHEGGAEMLETGFELLPGTLTMLTGPSGVGKTTLLKTLAGFYGGYEGRASSAGDIYWLPQRTYTFVGSLRANLAYPEKPDTLSDERAVEELKAAGLGSLASSLDTVCDWSVRLSGGEQQRLSMIRPILKKPTVLLMDEPTSAVDDRFAEKMLIHLKKSLPDTAVLMVTHQRTLFPLADRLITVGIDKEK